MYAHVKATSTNISRAKSIIQQIQQKYNKKNSIIVNAENNTHIALLFLTIKKNASMRRTIKRKAQKNLKIQMNQSLSYY